MQILGAIKNGHPKGNQQREYMAFVKNDPYCSQYYDVLYILFHTGLRISEFSGLTTADVDLVGRKITVDHQMLYTPEKGRYISVPKTASGKREIPITDDVCACFHRLAARPAPKIAPMVDGRCGFFCLTENGHPMAGRDWANRFCKIWEKFSRSSKPKMPKVTPHVCRHTFCSNMVRRGMNIKVLQYIMGHANSTTTLDIYTEVSYSDVDKELRRVAAGD